MAGAPLVTLSEARGHLKSWLEALEAVRGGSTYSIGGRSVTRQDITEIRAEIQRWHNTVLALEADAKGQTRALGAQLDFPTPGSGSSGLYSQDLWRDGRN